MFAIKNRESLKNLGELVSFKNQLEKFRLQDMLGKKNFHENIEKVFEPVADIIKNTSENLTKTITETSIKNNKAIKKLNENVLELMNDKGMIPPYLASSLVNVFKPENKSLFKLIKDHNSIRMNGSLINGGKLITLYSNILILEIVINLLS